MNYAFYFQCLCISISFIVSLFCFVNNKVNTEIRIFSIYNIFAGFSIFIHWISFELEAVVNNYLVQFNFTFLSSYIICTANYNTVKKLQLTIYYIFNILIIISIGIDKQFFRNPVTFMIGNMGLVYFCLFYYYSLFQSNFTFQLLKTSSFWIVSGIFFSMCLTIPIFCFLGFWKNLISEYLKHLLIGIIQISYGIMHLFFIKAYLCSIQKKIA